MSTREKMLLQMQEINRTLYGMEDIIKIYCLSKAADLTVLLLGPHATAKSSLARMWSITTGLNYRIVTSSEIDESLICYIDPAVFREKNIVQMRRGELMEKDHIIIDEYFLWLNKYRAKLHQLLEEKTYAGLESLVKTYSFLANPLTDYYSGQIPEVNMATMDRIDLFIPVYQPSVVPSETMIRKFSQYGRREKPLRQVITWEDYLKARQEIFEVELPSRVVIWLTLFAHSLASCKHVKDKWSESLARMRKLCSACNENAHLCAKVMLSKPRFLRATVILAKALAWLKGKKSVSLNEVYEAIKYTLPHRLTWIQEEKTYIESLEAVQELVSQFNDEMLAWRNRGIFDDLAKVVEASKQVPPRYEDRLAQRVATDVSEVHVLSDFVRETLEAVKKEIKQYYYAQGTNTHFRTLNELKEFLEQSGLDVFDRDQLLFDIALCQQHLSLVIAHTSDNVKGLVNALTLLHKEKKIKIEPKRILLQRFSERVSFDSPLLKIREKDGMIHIIFEEESIKKTFQEMWDEICQVQKTH